MGQIRKFGKSVKSDFDRSGQMLDAWPRLFISYRNFFGGNENPKRHTYAYRWSFWKTIESANRWTVLPLFTNDVPTTDSGLYLLNFVMGLLWPRTASTNTDKIGGRVKKSIQSVITLPTLVNQFQPFLLLIFLSQDLFWCCNIALFKLFLSIITARIFRLKNLQLLPIFRHIRNNRSCRLKTTLTIEVGRCHVPPFVPALILAHSSL